MKSWYLDMNVVSSWMKLRSIMETFTRRMVMFFLHCVQFYPQSLCMITSNVQGNWEGFFTYCKYTRSVSVMPVGPGADRLLQLLCKVLCNETDPLAANSCNHTSSENYTSGPTNNLGRAYIELIPIDSKLSSLLKQTRHHSLLLTSLEVIACYVGDWNIIP